MPRPSFDQIETGKEFNQWYWLKEEMVEICRQSGLPYTGSKFELRDRIMHALDNNGEVLSKAPAARKTSNFNWAKSKLTLSTIITDNVSFGPNFRNFMKSQIGNRFTCHGDFMDWVKCHPGKTLGDAVHAWHDLEHRKQDQDFKRDIAQHNMLSQYVRDFLADNHGKTLKDALKCWKLKKSQPTKTGFITYSKTDLGLAS